MGDLHLNSLIETSKIKKIREGKVEAGTRRSFPFSALVEKLDQLSADERERLNIETQLLVWYLLLQIYLSRSF